MPPRPAVFSGRGPARPLVCASRLGGCFFDFPSLHDHLHPFLGKPNEAHILLQTKRKHARSKPVRRAGVSRVRPSPSVARARGATAKTPARGVQAQRSPYSKTRTQNCQLIHSMVISEKMTFQAKATTLTNTGARCGGTKHSRTTVAGTQRKYDFSWVLKIGS